MAQKNKNKTEEFIRYSFIFQSTNHLIIISGAQKLKKLKKQWTIVKLQITKKFNFSIKLIIIVREMVQWVVLNYEH